MIDHIDANVRLQEHRRRTLDRAADADDAQVFSVFIFDTRTAPHRHSAVVEAPLAAGVEVGPGWWERTRASLSAPRVFGLTLRRRTSTPT